MRLLFRALIVVGIGLVLALTPMTANAHYSSMYHGSDYANANSGHKSGDVNDQECDGNAVWMDVTIFQGTKVWTRRFNAGGCNAPVTHWNTDVPIFSYRICEEGNGCAPSGGAEKQA